LSDNYNLDKRDKYFCEILSRKKKILFSVVLLLKFVCEMVCYIPEWRIKWLYQKEDIRGRVHEKEDPMML